MKRWALCKIISDPQEPGMKIPAIGKYPANYWIVNSHVKQWVLARISSSDLTGIEGDPDIYILPDATLDTSWGSIPLNIRNTVASKIVAAGYVTTSIKTSWTVRQVLEYVGRQAQATFSTTAQDIPDIP